MKGEKHSEDTDREGKVTVTLSPDRYAMKHGGTAVNYV
jgi:hypothetical protein